MKESTLGKPFRLTGEHHGEKVMLEKPDSDVSLEDLEKSGKSHGFPLHRCRQCRF